MAQKTAQCQRRAGLDRKVLLGAGIPGFCNPGLFLVCEIMVIKELISSSPTSHVLAKMRIFISNACTHLTPQPHLCTWGRSPNRIQLTHVTVTGCVSHRSLDLETIKSARGGPACERFLFLRKLPGPQSASREQLPQRTASPGVSPPPRPPSSSQCCTWPQ